MIPGEMEKFFYGRCSEKPIFFFSERRHSVSGLTGNGDSDAVWLNDLADFFNQHSCAVKVDLENGFDGCLTRRYAGGINKSSNRSEFFGKLD